VLSQAIEGKDPERKGAEGLPRSVGAFGDPDSPPPPKNPVHLLGHPLRLLQVALVTELPEEGEEADHSEGIDPEVP
jgi:hypothetical protein